MRPENSATFEKDRSQNLILKLLMKLKQQT